MASSPLLRTAAALAFIFWALLGTSAKAVETVESRGAVHDGFARIVFAWPAPVSYDATIEDGVLRVTFARPVSVELGAVRRRLGAYIRDARVNDDGRSVEFSLTGEFALRTFTSEKSIIVDLVENSPAAADDAAGSGPRIAVRAAEHPDYSRVVFDWRNAVGYEVSLDGGDATIRFDRAATIDLKSLNAAPPGMVRSGRSEVVGGQTVVTLNVKPGVELRHFRSGDKVVLDFLSPPPADAVVSVQPVKPPPSDAAPEPTTTAEPAAAVPPPAAAAAATSPPEPTQPEQPSVPPPAIAQDDRGSANPVDAIIADAAAAAAPVAENAAVPPEPVSLLPSNTAVDPDPTPRPVRAKSVGTTAARVSLGPPPIGISVVTAKNRTLVSFNIGKKLAGAAFIRGDNLWVVIPESYSVDLDALRATKSPAYEAVDQVPHPSATILRFKLRPGFGATFHRRGAQWMAQFTRRPEPPAAIEVVTIDGETPNPRVRLSLSGVAEDIEMRDPDDGATLVVVPVTAAGAGVVSRRRFPGFDLLATAQGVAVRPTAEGVDVLTGPVGIEIVVAGMPDQAPIAATPEPAMPDATIVATDAVPEAPETMEPAPNTEIATGDSVPPAPLSDPSRETEVVADSMPATAPAVEAPMAPTPTVAAVTGDTPDAGPLVVAEPDVAPEPEPHHDGATKGSVTTLFDLAGWRRGSDSSFFANRRDLQYAAANAQKRDRKRARLELSRFLFAHGYFAELIGVLSQLTANAPDMADTPEVRAMRGVAELMLGRVREAAEYLNDPALDVYDDVALWRGVLSMRLGEMESAVGYFVRASSLWIELAPYLRSEIGLMAAEAAIEASDLSAATTYLDSILVSRSGYSATERARYLRGRVFYAAGNSEEATKQWEKVADSDDRLARAGTRFYRTLMNLENEEISPREAIDTLEKLRFAWRGDEFELRLLQQLAEMYVSEKEYRRGLEAMKQAVTRFARHPLAAALATRMSELFSDVFVRGGIDDLSPRKALTLYQQFRELTPVGKAGDEVIQSLADRLVAVDLLDRAGELLDHQVNYRLRGLQKVKVGTRLAVIRLMDQKPDGALQALENSRISGIPKELARQRRHLKARALAELGQTDDALKLLARDSSRDAQLLRADMYWRAERWRKSALATALVLKQTKIEKPLDPFASRQILRFVVALALANDRLGLQRARKRYLDILEGDDYYEAVEIMTNSIDRKRLRFRDLPAAVADIAGFEAFLASYRDRVRKDSLSAIN